MARSSLDASAPMRLLADSRLHGVVVEALRAAGHDLDDVRLWPVDPGDAAILRRAADEGRVIVTSDGDFGELVVFGRAASAGVLVVAPDMTAQAQAEACVTALATERAALQAGGLVIVSNRGVRVRPSRPQ